MALAWRLRPTEEATRNHRMKAAKRNLLGAPVMGIVGATKYYGPVQALKAVNLTIRRGQVHAVVGENGAGKSTLIGIAAGAVPPDFAVLRVAGKEIKRPNARKLPLPSRRMASVRCSAVSAKLRRSCASSTCERKLSVSAIPRPRAAT